MTEAVKSLASDKKHSQISTESKKPITNTEIPSEIVLETFSQQERKSDETFHTITNTDNIRWEPLEDRDPPAVKLIRRGKGKQYIATISKGGKYAGLYASWEPALQELKEKRGITNRRRIRHTEIGSGVNPELGVGTPAIPGVGNDREGGEFGVLRDPITNTAVEA